MKQSGINTSIMKNFIFLSLALSCGILLALLLLGAARAQGDVQGWRQSNTGGFGDPSNTNASALAVFAGQMYAGTWNENGAQVWRTEDGHTWTQLSPSWSISNTDVADIESFGGYLYFGTANGFGENTGEIWRTDGTTWEQVAADGLGDANNTGFNALATFSDMLIAATTNYSTGVEVWSSPSGDLGTWGQVNADGFGAGGTAQDIAMQPYEDYLYLGLSRLDSGLAELWRTHDGMAWTPVFTDGLGSLTNTNVSAMAGFKGYFYIGLRNLDTGGEVWRSADGLDWTPVFTGGLGTVDNGRPYGLIVFNDQLYLVFSNLVDGAQVWRTGDGVAWEPVLSGGWGDSNNGYADYSNKSAAVFNSSLYIGTINNVDGGEIWQKLHPSFLPLISRPQPGISGHVNENGLPAAGVSLELLFYNGFSWSTYATQTTDAGGNFKFTNVPALNPGQSYDVRYSNTSDTSGRLWVWWTRELTSYSPGDAVEIGDFDIADIALLSPVDGATVSLPYSFRWTPRPATPSDQYEFNLYDFDESGPYFFTDPPLGYVGSYTLGSLPEGFASGVPYGWEVWVYSPDGGSGISYELRLVTFEE